MPICTANTADNKPCRGHAVNGSRFCYFHDLCLSELRRESQKKGGSKQTFAPISPHEFDLDDPRAIAKLLAYTANRIVSGQLDPKAGNSVAYLADTALRAHEAGNVVDRLERLERLQQTEQNAPLYQANSSTTIFEDDDDADAEQENESASSLEDANKQPDPRNKEGQ
jgi:hypothetical protein